MNVIMVGCQVAIVYVGGRAFSIVRLDGVQWAISVVVAVLCVPWGVCVRLFPDRWFGAVASVVGTPFVCVYRPVARGTDHVMGIIKSTVRRGKGAGGNADDGQSCVGRGKSPVETIRVAGDVEKGVV